MEEAVRYLIQEPIGEGGTASVFRAWDQQLGRWVAIKRLADDPDVEAAIRKEAEILAALNHPNIVTIYDFGADETGPFVVMELVNGKTLEDIAGGQPLTIPQFAELVNQVCRGVSAAHSRGLVHRDLKPGNLMMHFHEDGSFTVKILDFGLARTADEITLEHPEAQESVMGSAFTISPEQLQRMPADVRSDVYSLGVVFYFALTGHYPYENSDIHSMIEAHLTGNATPAHLRRPGVSQRLSQAIAKMMAVDPNARVQSAEEARQTIRTSMHPERPAEPVIVATAARKRNKKLREFGTQLLETICLSAAVAFVVVKVGFLKTPPAPTTPPVAEATAEASPEPSLAGASAVAGIAVSPLDLNELGKHVDQVVTAEGTTAALAENEVLKVRNLSFSTEDGKSLIVSFPMDEFPAEKVQTYVSKHIRVTGPLTAYFRTYRIVAHPDTRVEILADTAAASAPPVEGAAVSPSDLTALEAHLSQPVTVEGKTATVSENPVLRFRNLSFEGEEGKTLILSFPMDDFTAEKVQTYVGQRIRVTGTVARYFGAFRILVHPGTAIAILAE